MPKISCKAILFDMDGVLIDSTPVEARVWSWWARQHGFDPDDIVHKVHGRPGIANIRELLPNADHEAENREVQRREILDVDGVVPLPASAKSWPPSARIAGSSSRQEQDHSLSFEFVPRASLRQAAWSPPTTSVVANPIPSHI